MLQVNLVPFCLFLFLYIIMCFYPYSSHIFLFSLFARFSPLVLMYIVKTRHRGWNGLKKRLVNW